MTILRTGFDKKYSNNWASAFGKSKKKKTTAKKSTKATKKTVAKKKSKSKKSK